MKKAKHLLLLVLALVVWACSDNAVTPEQATVSTQSSKDEATQLRTVKAGTLARLFNTRRPNNAKLRVAGNLNGLAGRLNRQCGYSHSCAQTAEILYKENGYGSNGLESRAFRAWMNSSGHRAILTNTSYKKMGAHSIKRGSETIVRAVFTR